MTKFNKTLYLATKDEKACVAFAYEKKGKGTCVYLLDGGISKGVQSVLSNLNAPYNNVDLSYLERSLTSHTKSYNTRYLLPCELYS